MRRCVVMLAAVIMLAAAPAGHGPVEVAPAVVKHETFDPAHPPTPAPPIQPGEAAACSAGSHCDAVFSADTLYRRKSEQADQYEAAIKVQWVRMKVSLDITVWLPTDAAPWLKEHEEGHRQIYERVYATAEKAALATTRKIAGQTFTATGKNAADAEKQAMLAAQNAIADDYNTHVCGVWARVNDIYDAITAHGMNSLPGRKHVISAAEAIEAAFKQYAAETAATQPATQPKPPAGK